MINRAALLLKYKEPIINWINEADPVEEDPGLSLDVINQDRTVYLISDEHGDSQASLDSWIKHNFKTMFEYELEGWYTDERLWPKERTLELFYEWFDIECHTVLIDTIGGEFF